MTLTELEYLRREAGKRLSKKRFEHVLGCEKESIILAKKHGADANMAASAALLHDIAKEIDVKEQLKLLDKWGIIRNSYFDDCPQILHALTGAEIAGREFGLSPELCEAIRRHASGGGALSIYGKILYVADYTEQTRPFAVEASMVSIRETSYLSLERAVYMEAALVLQKESSRGRIIHPDTLLTYNTYAKEIGAVKNVR